MTGAGVCCDPISWFKAGIIKQPSMFLLGLPAIGKSTFVRREVLGLSALGMNAIIPGDLKPDYASLVNMLGGQVIRLGAGIGVVNPLDPGDLHYALQRLEGKARKDLTDYYNDTRAALMEVLLTIMRTGREADDVGGARGVTARESDILSVAVRVLHDRHGDDPQPPVIADLRDLLREGPDEVRMAAVWDDPENDELYRAQVRGLLADLHGFSNRMTKLRPSVRRPDHRAHRPVQARGLRYQRPGPVGRRCGRRRAGDHMDERVRREERRRRARRGGIAAPAQPRDHHGRDAPRFARQPSWSKSSTCSPV